MALSSSESDGEIFEGVTHSPKVPQAQQPLRRAPEVDLTSRPTHHSLHPTSPSISPPHTTPADHSDRSTSPSSQPEHTRKKMRYDRNDNRSYRGGNGYHGGRDRGGQDTRNHRPHYEDPRSQRNRVSYEDVYDRRENGYPRQYNDFNHNGNSGRGRGRDRGRERPGEKRQRDEARSRSPYYRGRDKSRSPYRRSRSRSPYHAGQERDRERNRNQRHEASVNDPSNNFQDNRNSNRGNDIGRNGLNTSQHFGNRFKPNGENTATSSARLNVAAAPRSVRFDKNSKPATSSVASEPPKIVEQVEPEFVPEPIDQEAEVEKRRLRREALKARLKSQQASSLSQELQTSTESASSTPTVERLVTPMSRSVSPPTQSPMASLHHSVPGSPVDLSLSNEENLVNHAVVEAMEIDNDEQAAGDYDPTADMRAERLRGDHRGQEISSANFNELKQPPKPIATTVTVAASPVESKNMPAPTNNDDDDDYDMFDMNLDESMFDKANTTAPATTITAIPQGRMVEAGPADNFDDAEGYYRPRPKEILNNQYEVIRTLGNGVFSNVCQARHIGSGRLVAIKLIRNNETMQKAGLIEIEIIKKLNEADPEDKKHIIRFEGQFEHRGHLCMVFESLHENLRELIKRFGRSQGLNMKAVRIYGRQIFLGLSHMKKCEFIHADLKPDNIIVSEDHSNLKICDLGTATEAADNTEPTAYIASRFYRAPEVILGISYGYPFDVWSIGCTLFELYTGKIAFTGATNNQMLKAIMECRGKFSMKLLKKGRFAGRHFEDDGRFRSEEFNPKTLKPWARHITFTNPVEGRSLRSRILAVPHEAQELKEIEVFIELLEECLNVNPEKRITPNAALGHRFFSYNSRVVNIKSNPKTAKK